MLSPRICSLSSSIATHLVPVSLLMVSLLTGCVQHQNISTPNVDTPPPSPQWRLNKDAAQTYYYLQFTESARKQNRREAQQAVRKLLMLNPAEQVYIDICQFYRSIQEPVPAREVAKAGLARFAQNEQLTILLAGTYMQERRIAEGLDILEQHIKHYPSHSEVRQRLGQIYFSQKQYPEAIDIYRGGPDTPSPITRYYIAQALVKINNHHDAGEELEKAVKAAPNFVEAWAELAYVYELQKDFVAAEKTYVHLIESGIGGQEAWLRLISLTLKLNHPQKALELSRQGPNETSFVLQAATLFIEEQFYTQAKSLLQSLLDQPQVPEEVYFHMALVTVEADRDYETAISFLKKISPHGTAWSRAVQFRCRLLMQTKREKEALRTIIAARKSDPGNRMFWELETDILASIKQYRSAQRTIDAALKRWPTDPELLFSKASLYDSMKDKENAFAYMEQVILADPEHPRALNYVGYSLADAGKDLERAKVLIEKAVRLDPGQAFIMDSLAWVQFKLGKLEAAWETIQATVALTVNEAVIWEHYGDIAHAVGNIKAAKKGYQKALKLTPENPAGLRRKLNAL